MYLKCDYHQSIKIVVACENPTPTNGLVNPSGLIDGRYIGNIMVSFMCDYGFHLVRSDSSTCQASRTWNPQPRTCIQGNYISRIDTLDISLNSLSVTFWMFLTKSIPWYCCVREDSPTLFWRT